jgi:hypothetical protein
MRQSGLRREKWDRPDYLRRTINRVLRGATTFYGDGPWRPPDDEFADCVDVPYRDDTPRHTVPPDHRSLADQIADIVPP